MGRVHNLNSPNTSLFLQRRVTEARVNGKDWTRIQQMYSQAVVDEYRYRDLAQHGQTFASVLQRGLLNAVIERHGLFRAFQAYVRAFENERPKNAWENRGKRMVVTVHPEDPDALERLFQDISNAFRAMDSDDRHFHVVLYNTARPSFAIDASTQPRVALGMLMTAQPYQFEAVVRVDETRRRRVLKDYEPRSVARIERKISGHDGPEHHHPPHHKKHRKHRRRPRHHSPRRQRLSVEERNLAPIATQLVEHIAANMARFHSTRMQQAATNNKAPVKRVARRFIRSQLFVSKAVQAAVLDDALYKAHGASSAREYYGNRGVNIGQLINDLTSQIRGEMKGVVDPTPMLKREAAPIAGEMGAAAASSSSSGPVLDQDAAKKIFKSAIIGICLLDRFKEWTGYYGSTDDSGPDQGPSASLGWCRAKSQVAAFVPATRVVPCPPVHERVYCDPVSSHVVEESSGPNVITQSVIVKKSDDHHKHHGHHGHHHRYHHCRAHPKRYHCSSDTESSSSDDEDRLLRRAHGACTTDSSASSDSDCGEATKTVAVSKHKTRDVTVQTPGKTVRIHEEEHSNFLKVLKKSGIHFEAPCLVLAPHNSVFNDQNLLAVENAVAAQKRTYKDFVLNYVVRLPSHEHFRTICLPERQLKLVSIGGRVFEVSHPSRMLIVSKKYADAFQTEEARSRLRFSDQLFEVDGYPSNVKFATLRVLHQSFPSGDK